MLSETGCFLTQSIPKENDVICWTVVAPSTENIRNLVDKIEEGGFLVKRDMTLKMDVSMLLSDRQEEAIRTAVENGYYDVPRKIDMVDLSHMLGCSKSTLNATLRNAEKRIMNHYVLNNRDQITNRRK
jgi:predicted DNA binding protein